MFHRVRYRPTRSPTSEFAIRQTHRSWLRGCSTDCSSGSRPPGLASEGGHHEWIRGTATRSLLRGDYEGRDPVTGKEVRRWHPAGTDRVEAERLAAKLAAKETSRIDAVRSLTFGAYLTSQWLPAKKLHLATSTYRGYERNVQRHILPPWGGSG